MPVSGLTTNAFFPVPGRELRTARQATVEVGDDSRRLDDSRRDAVTIDIVADGEPARPDVSRTVDSAAASDRAFFQAQSSFDELPTDRRNALSLYAETAQLSLSSATTGTGNEVVGVDTLV